METIDYAIYTFLVLLVLSVIVLAFTIFRKKTCNPICQPGSCGDDGCGGVCGTCPGLEVCNANGECEPSEDIVPVEPPIIPNVPVIPEPEIPPVVPEITPIIPEIDPNIVIPEIPPVVPEIDPNVVVTSY